MLTKLGADEEYYTPQRQALVRHAVEEARHYVLTAFNAYNDYRDRRRQEMVSG